jgi:putative superfamily III holin-X
MHTHETEQEPTGLGASAKLVAERASTLVRLEMELAALELKRKAIKLAAGIGLAVGAAVLLLYALGFGLAAAAAGIATALPVWGALLIVMGGVFVLAMVIGAIAAFLLSRGTPPVPEQAIAEAKLTTEALRSDGHG